MLLQIIIAGMTLGKKSVGRKKNDPFFCNFFHIFHQFQPLLLHQMFYHIKRDTSVKLSGFKVTGQFPDITLHKLVMTVFGLGLSARRRITFSPERLGNTQMTHGHGGSTSDIQGTLTAKQSFPQGQLNQYLIRIFSKCEQFKCKTDWISHTERELLYSI